MLFVERHGKTERKEVTTIMKKVLAILFAMMFVVATTGLCFAQAAPAKAPEKKEAAPAPEKKADDKAKKAEPKKAEKKA